MGDGASKTVSTPPSGEALALAVFAAGLELQWKECRTLLLLAQTEAGSPPPDLRDPLRHLLLSRSVELEANMRAHVSHSLSRRHLGDERVVLRHGRDVDSGTRHFVRHALRHSALSSYTSAHTQRLY